MIKFLILLASLMFANMSAQAAQIIAADKASKLADTKQVHLIDIRRPDEWKSTGVAKPAYQFSMHEEGFLQRLSSLTKGKKDASIALICATGARSTWLANELEKRGYTNILNVREGMMGSQSGPGWLKRGLPTKPSN